MVAAAAVLGMFLAALDIALNVALPSITADLNTDLQTVQWVIVAYIATRAGLVMAAGSFGDRFGLRPVYLFGTATYLASMVLIALSPNLAMVVGFRVLQAVAASCLYAVSPAIVAGLFPAHRRGLSMGLVTAGQALGMLAGTLGAGLLVHWFDWEAVFFGRIPFAAAALFLGARFMVKEHRVNQDQVKQDRVRPGPAFDLAGAAALTGALVCLVIGLRLGRSAGWDFVPVVVLLPLAALCVAWFWRSESRAAWPVLPLYLLKVRGFVISALSMFLSQFGTFVIWFIFPFYIVQTLGRGPFTLGVMLGVMAILNMGFAGVGGWLCDRVGTLRVGLCGLVVIPAGLTYMGFLDSTSSLGGVALPIAVVGTGLGLFQAASYALMMSSVSPERFGTASAALSLAQASGTVLAVAVVGGIFALSYGHHLSGLADLGVSLAEGDSRAFIRAFQDVFRLGAAIALLGGIIFLFSRRGQEAPRV